MDDLNPVAAALPAPTKPIQLSIPLPHAPHTNLHLHLTPHAHALLLFLTTTTPDTRSPAPVGSFVYAMPSRDPKPTTQPLSTPLYPQTQTLDLATRIARILARRVGRPVYVGCSAVMEGGDVGEEMEGVRRVVEVVVGAVKGEGVKAG